MELRNEAKKQKTLIPAESIANNIDLLTEILLRLQVKPLLRLKCVSKQWLSLISNPQFRLSHNCHHHSPYPTPTALLLKKDPNSQFEMVPLKHETIPKVPCFDHLNVPSDYIEQSCNGLLLCSYNSYDINFVPEYNYYICNPTTKQFKRLSLSGSKFKESLLTVKLAFNPLKSNHFKLICIHLVEKNKNMCQIDMYSSDTGFWRPLEITFTPPVGINFSVAVFYNGAVHWYSKDETSIYFDVDSECLNTMPMPNLAQLNVWYFGESRGHLHLIVTELLYGLQFDVLEMAVDYSGWFVRYHVNLDTTTIAFPGLNWCSGNRFRFSVLHVIRAKKEEESVVVVFVDDKTITYNVHDGTLMKLCDLEPRGDNLLSYYWFNTIQYFEVLTSV